MFRSARELLLVVDDLYALDAWCFGMRRVSIDVVAVHGGRGAR